MNRLGRILLAVAVVVIALVACAAVAQTTAVAVAGVTNWTAIGIAVNGLIGVGTMIIGVTTVAAKAREKQRVMDHEVLARIDRNVVKIDRNVQRVASWTAAGLRMVGGRVETIERDHIGNHGPVVGRDPIVRAFDFGEPDFEDLEVAE